MKIGFEPDAYDRTLFFEIDETNRDDMEFFTTFMIKIEAGDKENLDKFFKIMGNKTKD